MNKHNSLGAGLAIDLSCTYTLSLTGICVSVKNACSIVAPLMILQ